jgi:hypothetical protein
VVKAVFTLLIRLVENSVELYYHSVLRRDLLPASLSRLCNTITVVLAAFTISV